MAKVSPLMILPPAIFAGLAAAFYIGLQRDDPDQLPSALAGKEAPAVELSALGDLPGFDDATLRDGEVKLVNFWASWCAPCRVEHPNLEALAEDGLAVYGVNYKDAPDKALGFLEELGNPYAAVGADPQGRMALNWGLYGVPETYVIDGDGNIVLRFAGPVTQRVIENTLGPALAEARGE
ncbi:DsbE family thiol:disulfide interchange protein [Pseudooceanicola atlanticus]|uniref:Thiol:disulfide interchange protein n=1 Tax=Pseudooceanicola atlanticus TaxID=1461694 RepID=A0A0A0EFK5_9RHOB|nr:DsbE family thiol:disulfide interchange protein [Pseudooceanicola atlanticus]KGM47982.1 thiol:disulfide interchange protein [Pseudooceanicola atlanticus]